MNPNNYVTFRQAKRMKELGFPQDKTDFIWIKSVIDGNFHLSASHGCTPIEHRTEWYAAPNIGELLGKTNVQIKADIWIKEKGYTRQCPPNELSEICTGDMKDDIPYATTEKGVHPV
jgi:hypothetical protein